MKMTTRNPLLLAFCDVSDKEDEVKLKQIADLQRLLTVTKQLLDINSLENEEEEEKLQQLVQVLEMSPLEGTSTFYRKVQLKPKKFSEGSVVEMQLILKWGGKLTCTGRTQSMELGHQLRVRLYPARECGDVTTSRGSLLRLHATYRHDLKIYTSDEGRVILSAAAFAKGLLDLDNALAPIASMMLQSDERASQMLDIMPPEGRKQMDDVKADLSSIFHDKTPESLEIYQDELFQAKLKQLGSSPHELMQALQVQLTQLVEEISERRRADADEYPEVVPHLDHNETDPVESLDFVYARWRKLQDEFYESKKGRYDISKLPDIYDCSLYDILHNGPLKLQCLPRLHELATTLAHFMVPLEYGITPAQKSSIGIAITRGLVRKLCGDLVKELDEADAAEFHLDEVAINESDVNHLDRLVHTRLYFTSESHVISLLNVIRWGHARKEPDESDEPLEPLLNEEKAALFDELSAKGICYLTHLVLTIHESFAYPDDSNDRFRVRILFSPGANEGEFAVAQAVPLTPEEGLPLSKVAHIFTNLLSTVPGVDAEAKARKDGTPEKDDLHGSSGPRNHGSLGDLSSFVRQTT